MTLANTSPPTTGKMTIKLVHPYISGDGLNFSKFKIFYSEECKLSSGMVLHTNQTDIFIVDRVYMEEDIFENLCMAECRLMTQDPKMTITLPIERVIYMFSTTAPNT